MKKEVVIIGAGKFGSAIIENLKDAKKFRIILIDNNEDTLKEFKDSVDKVYLGDAGNEKFLKEIGIDQADIFVVGIGENIQSSVLAASTIKENFKGRIICKASNKQHEDILRKIGITEIVSPERAAAKRAFFRIMSPIHNLEIINSMDDNGGEFATEFEGDISIVKVPLKKGWINSEVKSLKISSNISIIIVYRKDTIIIAKGNTRLLNGDILLVLGKNKELVNFLND